MCTDCALILSGVRGRATVTLRGDKRTAKRRRAELAAAPEATDEAVFRYFDAEPPEAPGTEAAGTGTTEPAPARRPRRRRRSDAVAPGSDAPVEPITASSDDGRADGDDADGHDGDGNDDDSGAQPLVEAPAPPLPAVAQLEQLRQTGGDRVDQDQAAVATLETPEPLAAATDDPAPALDDGWGALLAPGRRRASDQDPVVAAGPATAPMIGEIRTIGGRRQDDQPQPEEVEAPGKARADVDANGNWIPPILRGLAPDARQASSNLPHRRRD